MARLVEEAVAQGKNKKDVLNFLANRGLPIDSVDFLKQAMLYASSNTNPFFRAEEEKLMVEEKKRHREA